VNYCCAKGNCDGCWRHWVKHGRVRYPTYPPRREPYPIVNQDPGDEDDSWRQRGYVE
jgi:hypothetical protein